MKRTRWTRSGLRSVTTLLVLAALSIGLAGCGIVTRSEGDSGSTAIEPGIAPPVGDEAVHGAYGEPSTSDGTRFLAATPEEVAAEEYDPTGTGAADASLVAAKDRMVIRTTSMRLRVDDVQSAVDDIRSLVSKNKGIITEVQIATDDEGPVYRYEAQGALADGAPLAGWVTVRVPSESLVAFGDAVAELGTVLRQAENESDVTQEHVDLSARLGNLKSEEQRLREFFDAAKKVDEMLAIERELSRVRGEIESMQGQIDYLERQAAMATITIELTEPKPVVRPAGTDWGFVDSLTQAVRAFVGTVNTIIVVSGAVLPIALIALIAFFVLRFVLKRHRPRTDPEARGEPTEETEE